MAGDHDRRDLYAAALGRHPPSVIRSVEPQGAPLPISSTGYISHFMQPGTIEVHGGNVVAQIVSWLDDEAGKLDWLEHVEASRQGKLF